MCSRLCGRMGNRMGIECTVLHSMNFWICIALKELVVTEMRRARRLKASLWVCQYNPTATYRQIQSTIELATNWGQIGDYVVWLGGRMGVDWSVGSRIRVECTVVHSVLYLSSSYFHYICRLSVSSLEEYFLQEQEEQFGELKEWMLETAFFSLKIMCRLVP